MWARKATGDAGGCAGLRGFTSGVNCWKGAVLRPVGEPAHQAGEGEGDDDGESKLRVHDSIRGFGASFSKTPISGNQSTFA
jgi:hypothetical protein